MSIQIASQTNTDSMATSKVAGDKKVSSNLPSGQSTSETVAAQAATVTLSSQGLELAKSATSEGVELSKSVEVTTAKQKAVGVLPPPNVAAFEADASLPRSELMAKFEKALRSLPRTNIAEVPRSKDPDRLAQALRATHYAWGNGTSPFASLTRNEVVAIYYDDSGSYTKNERMAAVKQLNEIDSNLWNGPTTKAANTGDWREVTEMGLKMYDEALPIEKMRYPANYKMELQQLLAYDNAKAGGPITNERRETLLEMMEALNRLQPEATGGNAGQEDIARPWNDSWSEKLSSLLKSLAENGEKDSAKTDARMVGDASEVTPDSSQTNAADSTSSLAQ
ncbi:hypothetical protein [Herbaspirillum hiltneri]|nr:hypothetical protein [Herbaspirillum hiltneri]